MTDYILADRTNTHWPGALPWRGRHARRGYRSASEARDRAYRIATHYAARHGTSGPDLRVVARGTRRGDS